jgi:hypothetical protein
LRSSGQLGKHPTLFVDRLKGERHDHLQPEKFGFRTADSRTARWICVRRR